MAKKKSKKESLDEAIAEAVGAGRELHLESVDFSDPNRPKTCLEVDFPILPINHVAVIEGNAGKPVYQMSKWWARRRSSVFRSMLIAAATKAPDDPGEAAKVVWDAYYGNHQKNAAFQNLKVADIFMGGGTTVVEGSRLGMQMHGNDLNPVAWFVVKNELAKVDPREVKTLLDHIEAEVKPQIMPFYACDCPRGHKGKWTQKSTGKVMGEDFAPLSLTTEQRKDYDYEGPEVIYTFWAKHGPCQATECDHRTPIMSSSVIAVKTLTVKAWTDRPCTKCGEVFDIERHEARMAPAALFVVAPDVGPYVVMTDSGEYACPKCGHKYHDTAAALNDKSSSLGKAKSKSVDLTLLVHPDWLKGSPGHAPDGTHFGGSMTDTPEATVAWNAERRKTLRLIEVRGAIPAEIVCPDSGEVFCADTGTVPKRSTFTCMESTCGKQWDVLESVKRTKKTGPLGAYAIQGYCPTCDQECQPYSGRFFAIADHKSFDKANTEWAERKEGDLGSFWPRCSLYHYDNSNDSKLYIQPAHGFTHWWMMFNSRQLLVHAQILRELFRHFDANRDVATFVLGAFQQYLNFQNCFCHWNIKRDCISQLFANNNFHPKSTVVENGVFSKLGSGNWESCSGGLLESLKWSEHPWEVAAEANLRGRLSPLAAKISGKSVKLKVGDPCVGNVNLTCGSSTQLDYIGNETFDLVVTDPPFGDNIHYSDLADFFFPWLRIALEGRVSAHFSGDYTPKVVEAIANRGLHPRDADGFYKRLLKDCWREAHRILKPAGILAFTFHHSGDEPWVAVLESLFEAGFFLEAAYPIRSDETKGDGQFGSKQIEFDIIHVCRKRKEGEVQPISWARLRRQIMQDVRQLQDILQQHQSAGLLEADLQVIRRGKALEYYSRHYGKVYIERGREGEFTVKDALVGINQLLDDEQDTSGEMPPMTADPYTRQFLRLFANRTSVPRDQMQKYLRGTGASPAEFAERGWCSELSKVFHFTSPLKLAQNWKGLPRNGMARDFDQAMFLVGACYENSGIRVQDTLNSTTFVPHPATGDILDWLTRHGGNSDIKNAAMLAKHLYNNWQAKNKPKVEVQRKMFDLEETEA